MYSRSWQTGGTWPTMKTLSKTSMVTGLSTFINTAQPMGIAYSVSKAGMIALTKCFADAVAKDNIRVNAIAPGLIETEIIDGVDQSVLDGLIDATPIRRIGQPDEMGDVVVFLLSERSSFMTGQTLVASGGRVMLP